MKKRSLLSLISLLLLISLLFSGCLSAPEEEPKESSLPTTEQDDDADIPDSQWLGIGNGVEFPLEQALEVHADQSEVEAWIRSMKITSVAMSLPMEKLMNRDRSESADRKEIGEWLDLFCRAGVETVLMTVVGGFWQDEYPIEDPLAFPYPESGTDQDSLYYGYLCRYGEDLLHLAKIYPQVTLWQTGTGLDQPTGAHPYSSHGSANFSGEERAMLTLDLAVSAKQAFRKENLSAKVLLGGYSIGTDGNLSGYVQSLYHYLESGSSPFGVQKPAQCYDAVNWIPTVSWFGFQTDSYVDAMKKGRTEMTEAGDLSPVLLTGVTWDDYGSRNYDVQQAKTLNDWIKATVNRLSFVKGVYPGMLTDFGAGMQGKGFLYHEGNSGFAAKEKGAELCLLYGGDPASIKRLENSDTMNTNLLESMNSKNGICFPLKGAADERHLNVESIMNLLETMNVKAMRNWMDVRTLLTNPSTLNQTEVEKQKQWIAMLNQRGIYKIIGMSQGAFWMTGNTSDSCAVPYPDNSTGSDYLKFLEDYKTSWKTLASAFPEITYWETGNERNHDPFLHPSNYAKTGAKFTTDEKVQITVDMAYYASLGIKEANPNAVVIFPGLAAPNGFASIANFLEKCYVYIESGKAPGGTDPDTYFDAVAWHFYYLQKSVTFTPENWKAGHDSIHQVMVDHGDSEKKVFLTEFGFSDGGDRSKDEKEAEYLKAIYGLLEEMPYFDSVYPFRTVEDQTAASWGGTIEIYYGMFRVFDTEHFGAKEKAKALCEIYGGDLSQIDRYIGSNKVYQ